MTGRPAEVAAAAPVSAALTKDECFTMVKRLATEAPDMFFNHGSAAAYEKLFARLAQGAPSKDRAAA